MCLPANGATRDVAVAQVADDDLARFGHPSGRCRLVGDAHALDSRLCEQTPHHRPPDRAGGTGNEDRAHPPLRSPPSATTAPAVADEFAKRAPVAGGGAPTRANTAPVPAQFQGSATSVPGSRRAAMPS
ncbi:hypothetical protein HRbin41_01512 [bacterium HR41]|nr:hypothetical protein HRbin41_01512 [bacterium HR41]